MKRSKAAFVWIVSSKGARASTWLPAYMATKRKSAELYRENGERLSRISDPELDWRIDKVELPE